MISFLFCFLFAAYLFKWGILNLRILFCNVCGQCATQRESLYELVLSFIISPSLVWGSLQNQTFALAGNNQCTWFDEFGCILMFQCKFK